MACVILCHRAAEKEFVDAQSFEAVGLNAAGKKLNKEEKAAATAATAAKKQALASAPGGKMAVLVQQEAVSVAQAALDAVRQPRNLRVACDFWVWSDRIAFADDRARTRRSASSREKGYSGTPQNEPHLDPSPPLPRR